MVDPINNPVVVIPYNQIVVSCKLSCGRPYNEIVVGPFHIKEKPPALQGRYPINHNKEEVRQNVFNP